MPKVVQLKEQKDNYKIVVNPQKPSNVVIPQKDFKNGNNYTHSRY